MAIDVAIWMVTYNHEDFVAQAIESVMMQKTNYSYCLFIGEDCSTDKTREICVALANQYPDKIQTILNTHNDIFVNARNVYKACFTSGAKYVMMIEGDDVWVDPQKIQKQVDYLSTHTNDVLTWHDYHIIDQNNTITQENVGLQSTNRDYLARDLKKINSIKTLTVCFRNILAEFPPKNLIAANGDTFLLALLGQHGGASFQYDIAPSLYRRHSGGLWSLKKTVERDRITVRSFKSIATYFHWQNDSETVQYYVDRLVKTQYMICHYERNNESFYKAFITVFDSIRVLLHFRKSKSIPGVLKTFGTIIFLNQNFTWQARVTS